MCGIVGYIGVKDAAPILLDGLAKLEYRGYDSAGMAVFDGEKLSICKTVGKLNALVEMTRNGETMPGYAGIGHTRWATHGVPNDVNSHPHCNEKGTIAVVHNGIIENYSEIKKKLIGKGYRFVSDTDTEVLANLLDSYYHGSPLEAITKMMNAVRGSYALGIIFEDHPECIYAVRKESPLIVGINTEGSFIASDVPAILKHTRSVYYLDNMEIAELTVSRIKFFSADEEELQKDAVQIAWDSEAAEKKGYDFFMEKEMYEQPETVRATMEPRLINNRVVLNELTLTDDEIRGLERIHIVACGSAYHAGMTGKYVLEGIARIPVEVDLASEFRYRNPILRQNEMAILISQSGETADTLTAMREIQAKGIKTLGIVNAVGSTLSREADMVLYTNCGPEIAVATTKAYSSQLIAMYLIALRFAECRETISSEEYEEMVEDLKQIPDQIELLLANKERVQKFANRYLAARDIFFIGRGIDYAISLEGSLKLKEISYIHSEAYAAGELKHGTISLIEPGTLVVAVSTQEDLYEKTINNMSEVRTRGAFVMAVTNEGNHEIEKKADYVIYIPETNAFFTNSLAIIPLQLFGYYVSIGKGLDADKPRNLAKSVTVE